MTDKDGAKQFSSQMSHVDGTSADKDVMLCYSRADLPFLKIIKNHLAERGITAWYDTQDIDKGTYWTESIAVAIKDCKAFIFLMSKNSLKSLYCMEELQMARAFGKPVFPVAMDSNLIPILPSWALIIIHIQWTFLSEDAWNAPEFNKLCAAISSSIGKELPGGPIDLDVEAEDADASVQTEKLTFSDFWSQCFTSDTVYALDLCKKLTAKCSAQFSSKEALYEAVDVLRGHFGLAVAGEMQTAYKESFEVNKAVVKKVLNIRKDDDVVVSKVGDYWGRLEAIKTALLSHLRGPGLALLGAAINADNVHYYIYLANYRTQDLAIKAGPLVSDKQGDTKSPAFAANVRSQSTLALGCLRSTEQLLRKLVVNRIMANLDDGDRLVREASCRAIGRMRAVEGVPKLLIIWRNDFIHPVRLAARDVLLKMGEDSQEAREAMELTEKLQQEMNSYLV